LNTEAKGRGELYKKGKKKRNKEVQIKRTNDEIIHCALDYPGLVLGGGVGGKKDNLKTRINKNPHQIERRTINKN